MSDDSYRHRTTAAPRARDTLGRVRAYLASRPSESWLFFLAGAVIGAIIG